MQYKKYKPGWMGKGFDPSKANKDLYETVKSMVDTMNYGGRDNVGMSVKGGVIRLSDPRSNRSLNVRVSPDGDNRIHFGSDGYSLRVSPICAKDYTGIQYHVNKALKKK